MPLLLGASSAAMAAGNDGWRWHDHWAVQDQFNATSQSNFAINSARPIQVNVGSDGNVQPTRIHNNQWNDNGTLQAQSAK
ncbi:hypothetical protein [Saccharopolyspora erythraea]|uniref:Uncharacterized protein n=1 Tax=Saccharopolyspora erythraea (strain ATCC 11635 / DSM 40517 / JCM 4748 / NBRC 13426 / NCIMB 8594 / NRRL 2338) TaxID=405948 RepID=A4FK94_SACEN|nr:hypothetical protein [Saccharopolyspora erythraea]QRK88216.1 hypothetical protein JQX30_26450 [Saccharopolyspora erythraea]CAM04469.1 hypothetical protein SACE_5229 [Saccharopolyspora erythraea NRRL 2338]